MFFPQSFVDLFLDYRKEEIAGKMSVADDMFYSQVAMDKNINVMFVNKRKDYKR